jgi:hypothetical protein
MISAVADGDGEVDDVLGEELEAVAIIANTLATGGKTISVGVAGAGWGSSRELKSWPSRWAIGAARAKAATTRV